MGVLSVVEGRCTLRAQESDHEEGPMSTGLNRLLHQSRSGKKNSPFAPVRDYRNRVAADIEAEQRRGLKADDRAPAVPGRGEPTPYDRGQEDSVERRRYRCNGAMGPSGIKDLQPANFEVKRQSGHNGRIGGRIGLAVDRVPMVFGSGPGHHSEAGTHGQHQMLGSSNDVLFGGVERTCDRSGRIEWGGEYQARGKKKGSAACFSAPSSRHLPNSLGLSETPDEIVCADFRRRAMTTFRLACMNRLTGSREEKAARAREGTTNG